MYTSSFGVVRGSLSAILLVALASCGGGGDGGGASISVSSNSVSATGTPGQLQAPSGTFRLTISGASGDLYLEVTNSENGIEHLIADDGTAQVTFSITYRDPGSLQNGTYSDDIVIRVCKDSGCSKQITGSPQTVRSTYAVSGEGQSTMQVAASNLQVRTNNARSTATEPRVSYTFVRPAGTFMSVDMAYTTNGIETGGGASSAGDGYYDFRMKPGVSLAPGTYTDTVTVRGCYHVSCVRQVPGSPFVFNVTYTVEARSDVVATDVPLESRLALTHDVVDAEYSRPLDSIVIVGGTPANALYILDPTTGLEKSQALTAAPTALAVSPDGTRAVVGHAGGISVVDLASVGTAGAPVPQVISVAMNVFDLALDNAGRVHASGSAGSQDGLRTIIISDQTQHQGTASWLDSTVRVRLHPSGDRLYTPDGLQFGGLGEPLVDIARWNIAGTTPVWVNNRAVERTQYEQPSIPCDNLWFDEVGARLFGSCGQVFAVSADPAADLVQTGTLPLSWALTNFKIAWLDHSATRNELALIEFDSGGCPQPNPNIACNQHLRLQNAATLATKAVYNLPPLSPGPGSPALSQRGTHVFYSKTGSRLLMMSKLVNSTFGDASFYYLSTIKIN